MATAYSIRPADWPDLERIMQLIDHSRSIMRAVGNASQWVGYPGPDLIGSDMAHGIGHVILQGGQIVGYFALLLDPEPTYAYIEDGQWIDDTTPYGTLHRLACAPGVQGIARSAFSFAEERCASVRVDTHRDNPIMLHIIAGRGYTRCGVVYMRDGSPREAFQKMTYPMVTPSLRNYVEAEILPRYNHFDAAHRLDHIQTVMAQSMELRNMLEKQGTANLNPDMVYTIAAYHDTGVVEGRERHHLVSGRIIREDARLREWFSPEQIETMAQAAEDHRASSGHPPRSIYGRIVAEADRFIDPETIVRRTVQFGLEHYPEMSPEEHYARMSQHLHEKYGRDGYLKLWFENSPNAARLELLREMMEDEARMKELFEKYYTD